ncbi:MAG: GAF domain-containing protein, partial [Comamonadaceae bacterium]
ARALPRLAPGLLRLNHEAGRQARERAGFAQYAALMRCAVALLPQSALDAVERRVLLHDAAEALVLERDFEAGDACLAQAEAIAGDPLETARGAELRMQWLIAQERTEEAFRLGLAALARIGLRLRPERGATRVLWELVRLKAVLRGRPPASWVDAAESQDPRHVQTQRLVFATVSVSHAYAPSLYAALGLVGTRHALQQGCTPWSSQLMSVAAHVLSGSFEDVDTGYALGELSLRLGERFGTSGMSFNHLYFVAHRKVSLTQTLPQMRQCFEQAERAGSFEIAGYAAGMVVGMTWNTMHSLQGLEESLHDVGAFSRRHKHDLSHDVCDAYARMLVQLRGPALRGPQPRMQRERAEGPPLAHDPLIDLLHDQLSISLNVTAGHYGDDVLACSARVRHNLHRLAGSFSVALHHWYDALLHVGRLRQQANAASLTYVRRHLRKLRGWARHCPENHSHRVRALEADLAALAHSPAATRLYDEAVALALRNGFTGDAAVIAHSCLRHCTSSGNPEAIRSAMERAHDLYTRWGATAMVRNLETSLPAFAWAREPAPVLPLDTGTLVKASQAISAELEMDAVAGRLLQQVMENAGARYCALLLEERGRLRLATEREGEPGLGEGRTGQPIEQTALPVGLLRSVWLTQKSVVLADAAGSHSYGSCARWQGAPQVSVLCVPVVAAGETIGVLYLENELIAGCFTPDREMLAHLLASQTAIAMANARLFQDLGAAHDGLRQANAQLEERVAERTRALEQNHAQLRQLERQHAADEERQRIMSDLHDGLGSQLFVTLSRVERGELDAPQVAGDLRACIGDMRLALEAMSPDGEDFLQAWGSFRFRWDSQLLNAGVTSQWDDRATGDSLPLASTTGLQVLRVAQEALTNVLKHARAGQVRVRLASTDNVLQLEIADDGIGPPVDATGPGRGLGNMRARAVRIGGAVTVEPANPGTLVRLRLPLR